MEILLLVDIENMSMWEYACIHRYMHSSGSNGI